jgi:plasmid stability protein
MGEESEMATFQIANMPDDLLEAIQDRAKKDKISAEAAVLDVLATMFPTKTQLAARRQRMEKFLELQKKRSAGEKPFSTAEEMVREDRNR